MKDYKLVIFDWDGTVMDSIGRIVACMQFVANNANLPMPTEDQVKSIIGLSLPIAISTLFPKINQQQVNELVLAYKSQYQEHCTVPTPLFENATALMQKLKSDNKILAVATGKAREGINRILSDTKTEHYFSATKTADDAKSKPDPDMLYQLLAELDIDAKDAIMIGDSIHDLSMAQNAGIDAIGVTYGVHSKTDLLPFNPVAIVDDMFQLERLLSS